jgi:hypothetical protein
MAPMLCVHFASTWALAGLIWVIQVVVYPQFLRIGEREFVRFHFGHCVRIGLLIAPLLVVEFITAVGLLYQGHREPAFIASVSLIPVNWLSTAIFQAPAHVRLMGGFDAAVIRRLIRSNWLRTLTWTARGVLLGSAILG